MPCMSCMVNRPICRKISRDKESLVEERISGTGSALLSEMFIGLGSDFSSPGRSLKKALLDQEWLVYFLQGSRLFGDSRGNGGDANWSALEFLDDREEDLVVH